MIDDASLQIDGAIPQRRGLLAGLPHEAQLHAGSLHAGAGNEVWTEALDEAVAGPTLVSTVLMTTLVVGPFHLARALELDPASVGLIMSTGPLVALLVSAVAGRAVDRLGATRTVLIGLIGVLAGSIALAAVPAGWGVPGYVAPLVVITSGHALFQTANNTAVKSDVRSRRPGSGLRHGEPGAQPRPHHRCVRNGRHLRPRLGDR